MRQRLIDEKPSRNMHCVKVILVMKRIVVLGNGMVSHRLCDRLASYLRTAPASTGRHDIVVCGEEPRPAYDRVRLTDYFAHRSADRLSLGTAAWYAERGIELRVDTRITRIERTERTVRTASGDAIPYDALVLATGSVPLVPEVPGIDKPGVFVYRTIEHLDAIVERCRTAQRAAVIGGGLLGLEAARAVLDVGIETHIIEIAPRLMPRQLDAAASALLESRVRRLGVLVHLGARVAVIGGEPEVRWIEIAGEGKLEVDLVIVSTGIRPRDELAREAGIAIGPRGGIVVDDVLRTSDPHVFAIGEVALHRETLYGLVAPGYEMADTLARHLVGQPAAFAGGDQSAKLKLLGTDVASFGDPFRAPDSARTIVYDDALRGRYVKLVTSRDGGRLFGGILVGDTSEYGRLVQLSRARHGVELAQLPEFGAAVGAEVGTREPADDEQVCSCHAVSIGAIRAAIRSQSLATVAEVKLCTRAGTGCGGCIPSVSELLTRELERRGRATPPALCEHFAYTRQQLFELIAARQIRTFAQLIAEHGQGLGCEICKPVVASILASLYNEPILDARHRPLQDSNDRFLANIQRDGRYSVVPRIPAGEVTPAQLIAIGQVAVKYDLYTKITGGQRIDLFGARVDQLPDIWEELIAAGFESGHAYGKAMRTVKSCVGSTWCRYGVQDSTAFAIRIEHRYKGIRAPHKLKSAVSGCVRECAEAQSKDFGLIATERGWNIYVCGNGGAKPRHADLLASNIDDETAIRYLDRFIMFYIRTADRLTRTSVWLDKLEGGIAHLRDVIINDSLGIAAELERELHKLVETYRCEWRDVVEDPARRAQFRHFANDAGGDDTIATVEERGQRRPADVRPVVRLPVVRPSPGEHDPASPQRFVRVASVRDVPCETGIAIKCGDAQIALFHLGDTWYATQNACPHSHAMVLARGILGDDHGTPKVACPLHKKTFDLRSGACLSNDAPAITTFPVRIEGDDVLVELPAVPSAAAGAREVALS
jgi:nitrite reductase (NADH) large subunit